MLRWLTAGESHGPALTAVLEGLPAGVRVERSAVEAALARRRLGYGRGARMSFEADRLHFLGGLRHGTTLGSPLALQVGNSEWAKWESVMSPEPVPAEALARADDVGAPQELARNRPLTRPRPGHADLVGMVKYGFDEARPVLERASARETAARVALGAVAQEFLDQACGIRLVSHTVSIGTVGLPGPDADAPALHDLPRPEDVARLDADPVRCADPDLSAAMVAEIDAARRDGDTLGGVVEVLAWGVPPGLGSHVHWDRRLDARLAAALMGIQAIKGVEVGEGFRTAARRGSRAPADAVTAFADERLLQHIFTNLLSNAVKYSPAGSSVEFDLERDGDHAICRVRDHGIGIPEADLEQLFSAFFRGRNAGQVSGTGLGLTIVKRCVELHRGKIKVESAVGRGTTVIVKLPLFNGG